jgi:hypothetical protein
MIPSGRSRFGRLYNAGRTAGRTLRQICSGGICRTRRIRRNTNRTPTPTPRINYNKSYNFSETTIRRLNGLTEPDRNYSINLMDAKISFSKLYKELKEYNLSPKDKSDLYKQFIKLYDPQEDHKPLLKNIFSNKEITPKMLDKYFKFDMSILLKINKYLARIIKAKKSINQYNETISHIVKYKNNIKPKISEMISEFSNSNNESYRTPF